jgi:hypothetical protein
MVKHSQNDTTTIYMHEVTLVPTQVRRSAPSSGGASESRSAGQTGVIETLLLDAYEGKLRRSSAGRLEPSTRHIQPSSIRGATEI